MSHEPGDSAKKPPRKTSSRHPAPATAVGRPHARCPIVGVGASAGGVDAFRRLLRALPAKTGLAFVLIQHLDPSHESLLGDILGRVTKMPVCDAVKGALVEPDHVYIMPPNVIIELSGGFITITPRAKSSAQSHPIDTFFRSLAEECATTSIGVVLSGTGDDGVIGLSAIKAADGLTYAQDPATAEYDGMPQAAIDAGVVDSVLDPEHIAAELVRIGQHPELMRPEPSADAVEDVDRESFGKVLSLVRTLTGLDLSHYRQTSLLRRVSRRMLLEGVPTMAAYLQLLQEHPESVETLYHDVLVNMTEFFRDPDALDALTVTGFPEILKSKEPDTTIRVWVPGCAKGQEAYSIVMLLVEFLEKQPTPLGIQMFATDVNASDIEVARAGLYPESVAREISPERLARFFTRVPSGYRIDRSIREMCVFAAHDVTRDSPFSRLDLVTFRNVLIYMESELQSRVLRVLHYALEPGGFLMLGSAETTGAESEFFSAVDNKHHIFQRKPGPARLVPPLPSSAGSVGAAALQPATAPSQASANNDAAYAELRAAGDKLQSSNEALRTINEEFQTAQEELQSTNEELTTLNDELRNRNIELGRLTDDLNNVIEGVEIPILILGSDLTIRRFTPNITKIVNVVQSDIGRPLSDLSLKAEIPDFSLLVGTVIESAEPLEVEVQDADSRWYSLRILPYKTSQGVLDGVVLAFVDIDLLKRTSHVAEVARDHARAIVATIREPLLTLDGDLRVREANDAFYETFAVTAEQTIGTILYGLGNGQWDFPQLRGLLGAIIPGDSEFVGLEVAHEFPALGSRVMVLNARRVREAGAQPSILLAIDDITDVRRQESLNSALNEIDLTISSSLEVDELFAQILDDATVALRADSSAVLLRRDDQWVMKNVYGLPLELEGRSLDEQQVPATRLAAQAGEPLVFDDILQNQIFAASIGVELKISTALLVPLLLHGEVVGSLSFHYGPPGGKFSDVEIDFARRLGTLLSLAHENAQLYSAQREIANTLQAALLTVPENIPYVACGYLYQSATETASVGGDFYDLFELDGGRAGILVGDVSGKGVEAATLTALVKNTIRVLSYENESPAVVVAKTSDIVNKATGPSIFCTLVFCVIESSTGRVVYCSAGHTRSMIKRPNAEIELLDVGSPLVGAFEKMDFRDGETTLSVGDVLVLYTDGVTEARHERELFGESRLVEFLGELPPTPVSKVAGAVFDEIMRFTGGSLSDDVAIVSVGIKDEA